MKLRFALNESRKMADSSDVVTPPEVTECNSKAPNLRCHQQSRDHQKVAQNANHFDAHLTTIFFYLLRYKWLNLWYCMNVVEFKAQ